VVRYGTNMPTYTDILKNPHFSQFAALLSVPYRSYQWRNQHPHIPFWLRTQELSKLLNGGGLAHPAMRDAFQEKFLKLINELRQADPRLKYSEEDIAWLIDTLQSEQASVAMSMLLAMASAKTTYATPVQIANATETNESTWRNRAASGEFVGAYKAGKQWLIPIMSLRACGITVDIPAIDVDVEPDEEE